MYHPDGFVTLLNDETGDCRSDLKLCCLEQQSISAGPTIADCAQAIQDALYEGDEIESVVIVVEHIASVSTETTDALRAGADEVDVPEFISQIFRK